MKSTPDPDTTPDQKFSVFENALSRVLQCSKDDLEKAERKYRRGREGKLKPGPKPGTKRRTSSSGHASGKKD